MTCHWWLVALRSSIAGASDPRSSLVEVEMGPVGLAIFPLVVQLAASGAVGSDRGSLRD